MDQESMKKRFMAFAIKVARLVTQWPKQTVFFTIERQIIRSSSGSAAGYRAACRARSKPDFIYKLGNVEEELDETLFWLEFAIALDQRLENEIKPVHQEGNQLLSIIVASINTLKKQYVKNH